MGRIVSVNLAVPEPNPAKDVGVTGITKRPVDHLVTVRAPGPKTTGLHSGLVGDQIFDIENHGGDDQAVYAYAREDYDWWQARLSRRLANGLFGENLTTENVDVNGAVIGERWRIGPQLVLQPTFGRIPCVTFQHKMGEPRWVKTFTRALRPGAYLRVVEPGAVWAGDPVTVEDRPAHGVTIAQAFRAYLIDPPLLRTLVETDGLPDDLRRLLAERLRPPTGPGSRSGRPRCRGADPVPWWTHELDPRLVLPPGPVPAGCSAACAPGSAAGSASIPGLRGCCSSWCCS